MTISLCTTCHNRAFQLKATFGPNMVLMRKEADVEWLILNYNSQDDLDAYLREQLSSCHAPITYLRETSARPWHLSLAKNIVHRAATGDIVMNLDCDNLIADALLAIRQEFQHPVGALHLWSGQYRDGTHGRIAVRRDAFHAAGGYDETFYPMAYQDNDLLERLRHQGVLIASRESAEHCAIPNTKMDSVAACKYKNMTWQDFYKANKRKSRQNIAARRLVANQASPWGSGQVEVVACST